MQDANSLRDFFDDPASIEIVEMLLNDGMIKASDRNALITVDGMLNSYGKNLVEDALRGRICDSYETLARVPAIVANKLDAVTPYILIAETIGNDWNITRFVSESLKLIVEFKNSPFSKNRDYFSFLNNIDALTGKTAAERFSSTAIQIAQLLMEGKKKNIIERFKRFSSDASTMSKESNAMFTITARESAKKNLGIVLESLNLSEGVACMDAIFERTLNFDWKTSLAKAATLSDLLDILEKSFPSGASNATPLLERLLSGEFLHSTVERFLKILEAVGDEINHDYRKLHEPLISFLDAHKSEIILKG